MALFVNFVAFVLVPSFQGYAACGRCVVHLFHGCIGAVRRICAPFFSVGSIESTVPQGSRVGVGRNYPSLPSNRPPRNGRRTWRFLLVLILLYLMPVSVLLHMQIPRARWGTGRQVALPENAQFSVT